MLNITDLTSSKEMAREEMRNVRGGSTPFLELLFSTGFTNKVADVSQAFGFEFAQINSGAVTNNQSIVGGNGITLAPVHQEQHQHNDMQVSGIGNVSVS